MELNTITFESTLLAESRKIFKYIIHQHRDIYVIGFYHSGGWDAIWPIFNTLDQIESLSYTTTNEDEFSHNCNLKWNPGDYRNLEDYTSSLPESEKLLQALGEAIAAHATAEELQIYWKKTLAAMEYVLRQLIQEEIFTDPNLISPIVYLANHEESFEDRFASITRINPAERIDPIKEEFDRIIKLHHRWHDEAFLEVMRDDDA
jgi:Domain of unknown function (DUF4303)